VVLNRLLGALALAALLWTWGRVNQGWRSPLDVWRGVRAGHPFRRSDGVDSGHVHLSSVQRRRARRPVHRSPVPELPLVDDGEEPEAPAADVAARRAWVRARLERGDPERLRPADIDRIGAEMFDCSERTIRRDREAFERRTR